MLLQQHLSWYDRVEPAALDHVPEVQDLIGEWPTLSAHFDLKAVLAAQIDGAIGCCCKAVV